MLATCNPGDEVIYPNPGFPIYESVINWAGATPVPLPITEDRDFAFSVDDLAERLTPKTKLVILNSPANPTGGIVPRELNVQMAKLLADHDCWILSDEVYSEMLYEGAHDTIASHEGLLERTILLDGFSKTFAMTGWRLGYAALPKPLVEPITRLIINSVSCTAPAVQLAGVAALEGPRDEVNAMMAEFTKRRDVRRRRPQQAAGRELHRPERRLLRLPERQGHGPRHARARQPPARRGRRRAALGHGVRRVRRGLPARLVRQLAREHRGSPGEDGRPARADGRLMAGRIVVTGRVPEPALDILREAGELDAHTQETALPVEELHAAIAGADAVVTLLHDRVDEAFLDAAGPQLRVVANVAVGYNNIDVRGLRARAACSSRTRPACSPTPRPTSRWR